MLCDQSKIRNHCLVIGEPFTLNFSFTDSLNKPKDLTGKRLSIEVGTSRATKTSIIDKAINIQGSTATIAITDDEVSSLGSGTRFYAVWIGDDQPNTGRLVVAGELKITAYMGSL